MRHFGSLAIVTGLLACCCQVAGAHARSESYSSWRISGSDITGVITVSSAELTSLVDAGNTQPLDTLLAAHLAETVTVASVAGSCERITSDALNAARGFVRMEIRFDCQGEPPARLHYRALFDRLPAHVHFARLAVDDGPFAEVLFTDRSNDWSRSSSAPRSPSFTSFLDLGIRHILGGIDHIAFLLGMLLVSGTVLRGVTAVTGFTLGHSLSLVAAVTGFVEADSRLVEAFIGFTVALLAVEYFLLNRPPQFRLAMTTMLAAWAVGALAVGTGAISAGSGLAYAGFGAFSFCYLLASGRAPAGNANGSRMAAGTLFTATTCFGLIHGFGFAGFLLGTGIHGTSLLAPLLGFNLGVEIGQLALLLLAFVVFRVLHKMHLPLLAPVAATGLSGIGVFWFISRSLGA